MCSHSVDVSRQPQRCLQRHNIELTQPALIAALKNPNPEVRYLAAQKLAEDKAVETIPLIVDAARSEKAPKTRMNMEFALAQFGEESGFAALEENCRSHASGIDARLQSAEYLLMLKRQSKVCLNAVLDGLQSDSDGYKMQAAGILPGFHDLSREDAERVFGGLLQALGDSYPLVRLEAGQSLVRLGDARAVPELEKAIAAEPQQEVRWGLEQDVKRLKDKILKSSSQTQ